MNHPRRTALVALCALALLVSGCSATKTEQYGDPQVDDDISIEDYSGVTATLDTEAGTATLPLDPYNSQTPQIMQLLVDAELSVTNQCLRSHGIPEEHRTGEDSPATADSVFFFWGLTTAKNYGLSPNPGTKASVSEPAGDPAVVQDCNRAGQDAIAEYDPVSDAGMAAGTGLDLRIRTMVHIRITASPEYADAGARIAECLTAQGLTADKQGKLDPQYLNKPLSDQVPVAISAATCAVDTGAVQQVYDLQAQYEAAYKDRYEAQLAEVQKHNAEAVPALTQMIADADAGTFSPDTDR